MFILAAAEYFFTSTSVPFVSYDAARIIPCTASFDESSAVKLTVFPFICAFEIVNLLSVVSGYVSILYGIEFCTAYLCAAEFS